MSFQYISAIETAAGNANVTVDRLIPLLDALGAELAVEDAGAAASALRAATDGMSEDDVQRLARIAAALPRIPERSRDVLTASFEAVAQDSE